MMVGSHILIWGSLLLFGNPTVGAQEERCGKRTVSTSMSTSPGFGFGFNVSSSGLSLSFGETGAQANTTTASVVGSFGRFGCLLQVKQLPNRNGATFKLNTEPLKEDAFFIVGWESGKCINIKSSNNSSGEAELRWCDLEEDDRERFLALRADGDAAYLVSFVSGLCLSPKGRSIAPGSTLSQEPCTLGDRTQMWRLSFVTEKVGFIENVATGLVVEVLEHWTKDGSAVVVSRKKANRGETGAQLWGPWADLLEEWGLHCGISEGEAEPPTRGRRISVGVALSLTEVGTLGLDCKTEDRYYSLTGLESATDGTQFHLEIPGDAQGKFGGGGMWRSLSDGRCWAVDPKTSRSADFQSVTCRGTEVKQRWFIVQTKPGDWFYIISAVGGLCLGTAQGNETPGSHVLAGPCVLGDPTQLWKLEVRDKKPSQRLYVVFQKSSNLVMVLPTDGPEGQPVLLAMKDGGPDVNWAELWVSQN